MTKIRVEAPILCLVTDRAACLGRSLEAVVAAAARGGAGLVQLRERDLSARETLRLGESLLALLRPSGATLVINDRADVAVALGAGGIHLGSGSLSVAEARRVVGDSMLVGASVHSVEDAARAEAQGADYLILGTIFETRSHQGKPAAGLALVEQVTPAVRVPVLGIGGITPANAASVVAAGASGVAVITAIQSARDVEAATRALLRAMAAGIRSR